LHLNFNPGGGGGMGARAGILLVEIIPRGAGGGEEVEDTPPRDIAMYSIKGNVSQDLSYL